MMTMTIEIPALDRLCGILEGWQRAGICQEISGVLCHAGGCADTRGLDACHMDESLAGL